MEIHWFNGSQRFIRLEVYFFFRISTKGPNKRTSQIHHGAPIIMTGKSHRIHVWYILYNIIYGNMDPINISPFMLAYIYNYIYIYQHHGSYVFLKLCYWMDDQLVVFYINPVGFVFFSKYGFREAHRSQIRRSVIASWMVDMSWYVYGMYALNCFDGSINGSINQ